jgi:hypothetical protein
VAVPEERILYDVSEQKVMLLAFQSSACTPNSFVETVSQGASWLQLVDGSLYPQAAKSKLNPVVVLGTVIIALAHMHV